MTPSNIKTSWIVSLTKARSGDLTLMPCLFEGGREDGLPVKGLWWKVYSHLASNRGLWLHDSNTNRME